MDPDKTYEELLSALKDGDEDVAAERAEELARWIRRGGFTPQQLSHYRPELSERELATVLAALREWQGLLTGSEPAEADVDDIASDGGKLRPLTADEIDAVCERLNAAKE